jgi:peroxiredoxin
MTMNTAKLIKVLHKDLRRHQSLYKLDPPYLDDPELDGVEYVVVSAVNDRLAHETYISPADEEGNITSWGELDGSFRGAMDHERALKGMGYEVV